MTGPEIALYALGVVIFLAAILVSIALHELGHLYFAKKFGCRVSQYMVGFGPTVWSRKKGETEYGIKLVPLGGYVKIIGMFPPETDREQQISRGEQVPASAPAHQEHFSEAHSGVLVAASAATPDAPLTLRKSNTGLFAQMVSQTRAAEFELVEPRDADRLFYKLPAPKKILVMLAGPGVNIALAFLCFLCVYGIYGVHSVEPTGRPAVSVVSDCVIPQDAKRTACQDSDQVSPARAAGLQPNDLVVSFNGQPVASWSQLSDLIHANGSSVAVMEVERDGKLVKLQAAHTIAMPRDLDGEGPGQTATVGFLGVEPESREVVTRHGPVYTLERMGEMTGHAVSSIVQLPARVYNVAQAIFGQGERAQDGPMSVIGGSRLAGEVAASTRPGLDIGGKAALLGLVVGSFNLFIGVFNLIPLLPLDGGHIAGSAFEGTRRWLAQRLRRPDPGHVNVARQLPVAYVIGFAMLSMSLVLMVGDIVVPLKSGL
ncbi:M50 family metallopeptidase [Arthrobacter sp. NPDC057388]|uniref:M50 family metallopeptidase n=1 Tax=Arthrobacter sp. NPDC057388 TaxID=3346116 RepID=UPI00362633FA